MPKGRRKSKKLKLKSDSLKSVLGVLLIVAGLLFFLSLFVSEGILLSILSSIQTKLFGYGSFIFPPVLILLSLLMFDALKIKYVNTTVFLGLVVLLISISGLSSSVFSDEAGGALGNMLSVLLINTVTIYGGLIILFAGVIISFILIFEISLDQIFSAVNLANERIQDSLKKFKTQRPVMNTNPLDSSDDDYEDSSLMVARENREEPTFEVVQSALEPVEVSKLKTATPLSNLEQSTPSLPYTDRVWEYPPLDILSDGFGDKADRGDVAERKQIIQKTLSSFGIQARVAETNFGPAVTQYALEFTSVNKIAKVTNLQNDIALALASPTGSVRIEAPIPGKSMIGIEVPNITTAIVNFKGMIASDIMRGSKSKLTIALGHNVSGLPCIADISKMPHMLIAGSTGSGKSVFLHSILFSLLFRCSPAECKLIMVDPKRVELVNYNDIPHLLIPVITEPEKALSAFKWAVAEMERRYKLFEAAKVRNLNAYNELSGFQALPYIVIVVDELAELMALAPAEMERAICRLAQLSRATGIHLILATQSPRVDVITGLIKANIPTRVAFSVASQIESRIIIDAAGAEKLLGKGDMLYVPPETSKPVRIQGVFVSDKEISNLVSFLKNSGVRPEYKEDIVKTEEVKTQSLESTDELFDQAVQIVMMSDRASASLLQRKLSIGYARAARLLDELEAKGIVGPADGSKPRDVLMRNPDSILNSAPQEE